MRKIIFYFLPFLLLLVGCKGEEIPATSPEARMDLPQTNEEIAPKEKILQTRISYLPNFNDENKDFSWLGNQEEEWILSHLYANLTKMEKGQVEENAANMPLISEDGLVYRFSMNPNVSWTNGDPVTAKDFLDAWELLLDSKFGKDAFSFIQGVDSYTALKEIALLPSEEQANALKNMGIDTSYQEALSQARSKLGLQVEENILVVTLAYPFPYLLSVLSHPIYHPIHQDGDKNHLTNGPFTLEVKDAKTLILKKRNPDDAVDAVHFHVIPDNADAFQKFEEGDLDLYINPPQDKIKELIDKEDPSLRIGTQQDVMSIRLNVDKEALSSQNLRRALSYGIHRQNLCTLLCHEGEVPAPSLIPFGFLRENEEDFRSFGNYLWDNQEGEIPELKNFFETSLSEEGLGLEDVHLSFMYEDDLDQEKLVEEIIKQWKDTFGLSVTPLPVSREDYYKKIKEGDFDLVLEKIHTWYDSPLSILSQFKKDSPYNTGHYDNPNLDEKLSLSADFSQEEVEQTYSEAERILMQDMPVIPLYFTGSSFMIKPYLSEIHPNPYQFPRLEKVHLAE